MAVDYTKYLAHVSQQQQMTVIKICLFSNVFFHPPLAKLDFCGAATYRLPAMVGQTKMMQPWEGSSGMQEGDGMDGQQGIGGRESARTWKISIGAWCRLGLQHVSLLMRGAGEYYLSLVSTGPQAQAQVLPVLCGAGNLLFYSYSARETADVDLLLNNSDGGRPPLFVQGCGAIFKMDLDRWLDLCCFWISWLQ
ncbi:hypothetical protein ARMGADRAFT_1035336 [Armillaria gallica]|uniref:Uncharacterized protein n=1 Tax=Armillaria gallica TaxID=47427 RepID=A0A2H3DCH2_ARMGA|nr:hypothetical protein ARMGADRAFT_1035336 [Armillaria gallica]